MPLPEGQRGQLVDEGDGFEAEGHLEGTAGGRVWGERIVDGMDGKQQDSAPIRREKTRGRRSRARLSTVLGAKWTGCSRGVGIS